MEDLPVQTHRKFEPLVAVDKTRQTYNVSRRVFVDPEVLAAEQEEIFERCWLYLGHESELPKKGDFVTRRVAGRQIIFSRDAQGKLNALLNACPHRGAMVCRERQGNAKSFQCFYHGWIFALDGACRDIPGADSYPEGFKDTPEARLQSVARFESYRGFAFVCFDRDAVSLETYLGGAKEYIDLVADHSEVGMTIVGGTQEYSIKANWNNELTLFGHDPDKSDWIFREGGGHRQWGHMQMDEHFVDCILEGRQPSILPEDGRRAVEIALKIVGKA